LWRGASALTSFSVDGQDLSKDGEASFQVEISKLVGVWSFGDWILLLRHLVFYFEDRRALVWDRSAQRQILRLLLLSPQVARKWTQDEREILELDSRARNLSASVYREEQELAATEIKIETSADVRAELETLEELQRVDVAQREVLDGELVERDASRQAARLRLLKAEQEREARYRDLERAKLTAIEARFPRQSDTARYILAQLMADGDCLACGTHVPAVAAELEERIERQTCVICGSDLSDSERHVSPSKVADSRVERAADSLQAIEPEVAEARRQLVEEERGHSALITEIAEFDAKISERSKRIDALVRRLPAR
jgi:hypothetical protein